MAIWEHKHGMQFKGQVFHGWQESWWGPYRVYWQAKQKWKSLFSHCVAMM